MYAEVIIDISHSNIDRIFDYHIPQKYQSLAQVGMRVLVPFGNRKNLVEGYIVGIKVDTKYDKSRIKDVNRFLDCYPVILPHLLKLAWWIKDKYHCCLVDALRLMTPSEMRKRLIKEKKVKEVKLLIPREQAEKVLLQLPKNAKTQKALMKILAENVQIELSQLRSLISFAPSSLKQLEKRGWIEIIETERLREPYSVLVPEMQNDYVLTKAQTTALKSITDSMENQNREFFLLHGVTGSGKTEIYIQSIRYALSKGKSAILLVPEISLTPQMVKRFRERFGDLVAVLHSRLSVGERYDEWRRLRSNKAKVVIGARSAVFAPLSNLGLIIIDEEHEQSYRSEHTPQYDACEIARFRCLEENATLVLGSATPSLERYYHSQRSEYTLLELPERIHGRPMPKVEIVDMREELAKGNRSIFSGLLFNEMRKCLMAGEQMILFLNRRGYSTFVSCRECGHVLCCNQCDVSLTYHLGRNSMKCHYCGKESTVPRLCPECNSRYIKYFGAGTQRVEEEAKRMFKDARVIRMDNDTTRTKDAHLNILKKFQEKEAQILIGTQMIAKGLDFPDVTLVGIIAADTTLNIPDFRSAERTFQLITQVSGRAGRDEKPGKVVVQCYSPDHFSIVHAARHDYKGFYTREINNRKKWQYPPFTRIVRILVTSEDEILAEKSCESLRSEIEKGLAKKREWHRYLLFLGHMTAPMEKVKGKFRWQILLKLVEDANTDQITDYLFQCIQESHCPEVSTFFEVNPINML
ncbi:MAG: primosomal protein N' [Clostridia bacterium]